MAAMRLFACGALFASKLRIAADLFKFTGGTLATEKLLRSGPNGNFLSASTILQLIPLLNQTATPPDCHSDPS
jgi:hypothetical protein